MAAAGTISKEEGLGLGIALAAHVALFAFLALHEPAREPLPIPERMDVSLATDVGLTSTAPDPSAAEQAAVAPELAPVPAPPAPEPLPAPEPVAERVQPEPRPTRPVVQPSPRPTARATAKPTPRPQPSARPTARPTAQPSPRASTSAKPAPRPSSSARPTPAPSPSARAGGSRMGADFLAGASTGERSQSAGTPAAQAGPAVRASIGSAMARQIKPHWTAPQGVDAERLVTYLSWDLNPDGTLKGRPRVERQEGITDSNRPQASLHAERAIRAVQLAAPFDLPDQYYDAWKAPRNIKFDRNL